MNHHCLELRPAPRTTAAPGRPALGRFTSGEHTHEAVKHRYKLYTPHGAAGRSLPLVVMLHACNQDPDAFAAGTAMNDAACQEGFYVLYPEQSREMSPSRCWNWFKPEHQYRESGEPALIASLTQAVVAQHGIDAARVYIAGLAAGGAMAATVAGAYPERFAAVGVHSGLPTGAACDAASALALMKTGSAGTVLTDRQPPMSSPVPTIVFHGDQDATVHPHNGERLMAAALDGASANAPQVERGVTSLGRHYTRTVHREHLQGPHSPLEGAGPSGSAWAEHWVVHGTGHAWSGGAAASRFADAKGPDATREMLRFFSQHALGSCRRSLTSRAIQRDATGGGSVHAPLHPGGPVGCVRLRTDASGA